MMLKLLKGHMQLLSHWQHAAGIRATLEIMLPKLQGVQSCACLDYVPLCSFLEDSSLDDTADHVNNLGEAVPDCTAQHPARGSEH